MFVGLLSADKDLDQIEYEGLYLLTIWTAVVRASITQLFSRKELLNSVNWMMIAILIRIPALIQVAVTQNLLCFRHLHLVLHLIAIVLQLVTHGVNFC